MRVLLTLNLSLWPEERALGAEGEAGIGMDTRVGTASPNAFEDNRQDGELESSSQIQSLSEIPSVTPGQEVQAVPGVPQTEGGGSAGCQTA